MQHNLINHSPDLKKLQDEGYQIEVNGGHLLAHHIPYLNAKKEINYGTLICVLTLASPTLAGKPPDHTTYFCGEKPFNADGTELTSIILNSDTTQLAEGIIGNHYFSSKPLCGYYSNYYEKVRTYSEIVSSQAQVIDKSVTTKPNKKIE